MAEEQTQQRDPIIHGSLGPHIFIASLLFGATVAWSFYDEMWGKRPWLEFQSAFVERYPEVLEQKAQQAVAFEQGLTQDAEINSLGVQLAAAEAAAKPGIEAVDERMKTVINPRVTRLTKSMTEARSLVTALVYQLEHAEGAEKTRIDKELEEVKQREIVVENVPVLTGKGETATETYKYETLSTALEEAKAVKAGLFVERSKLDAPARDLQKQIETAMERKRPGLSAQQVRGLITKVNNFEGGIRQIHIPDPIGLVDRCETCHLAIREPVEITADEIGGDGDRLARTFTSHPTPELLAIHDPERFGCTPCHGGNGAATVSVKEAHGRMKHWLWPMYEKENTEAGCLQCHESSLVLTHADTLNAGKELFRYRGCWGCHPREGFDVERAEQRLAAQAVRTVRDAIEITKIDIEKQIAIGEDPKATEVEFTAALKKEDELTLRISGLESELLELERKEKSLSKQLKMVGPSLRPVQSKLKPEWITQWIENPRHFRPTTRMPVFRFEESQLKAIAAAIWQAADAPAEKQHEPGDAAKGKELFESRGCMGCHAVEQNAEGAWVGGHFAPELSRLGEKANYAYIVEWIKDTPDWSLMPNLRLTLEESRDLASFLMTKQNADQPVAQADYAHLTDSSLREHGNMLVRHFGCAGCHDIAGFENVGKIGTELTTEGNKPIERLDFGLHTHHAKRNKGSHYNPEEVSYNHKSYFEWKLKKPEFFDEGKHFEDPLTRLRMPNFGLNEVEVSQLVTYMLGSVDSAVPDSLKHHPSGHSKDIMEGWWVIKKYNCMGCHQILPGQTPDVANLPQYEGENARFAPPSLVGVGARLNPEWLAKFLRNPALSDHDLNRNGVRSYLAIRMPTFNLWDEEIGALVRFFEAMSDQTSPYFPPALAELTEEEQKLARQAFLGADCLNCHASADQTIVDPSVKAPSFVHARDRLKPTWTQRWILDPAKLMIDTSMPTGLFRRDGERWIVAGDMSEELAAYHADHAKLFVRYMNTIDMREAGLLQQIKDEERAKAPQPTETKQEEFIEDE